MSTYTVDKSTWSIEATDNGIILESATLVEGNGTRWRQGAYRLRYEDEPRVEGFPPKTFKGESAWSNGERYFRDAVTKRHFGR